jgi:glycerate 2-kinase
MKPAFSEHRNHLSLLQDAALRAVDPAEAVRRHLAPADFDCPGRVYIVGAGKAGIAMTEAAEEILGERVASGVVSVPMPPANGGKRVEFFRGGHPVPTAGSVSAGRAMARLLEQTTQDDLVLVLISGGGSALVELPRPGIPLEDMQKTNRILLACGASIH